MTDLNIYIYTNSHDVIIEESKTNIVGYKLFAKLNKYENGKFSSIYIRNKECEINIEYMFLGKLLNIHDSDFIYEYKSITSNKPLIQLFDRLSILIKENNYTEDVSHEILAIVKIINRFSSKFHSEYFELIDRFNNDAISFEGLQKKVNA